MDVLVTGFCPNEFSYGVGGDAEVGSGEHVRFFAEYDAACAYTAGLALGLDDDDILLDLCNVSFDTSTTAGDHLDAVADRVNKRRRRHFFHPVVEIVSI